MQTNKMHQDIKSEKHHPSYSYKPLITNNNNRIEVNIMKNPRIRNNLFSNVSHLKWKNKDKHTQNSIKYLTFKLVQWCRGSTSKQNYQSEWKQNFNSNAIVNILSTHASKA